MKVNGKCVDKSRQLSRVKQCSAFRLARKNNTRVVSAERQFPQTCCRRIFIPMESRKFLTPSTFRSQILSSLSFPSLDHTTPSTIETSALSRMPSSKDASSEKVVRFTKHRERNKYLDSVRAYLNPLFEEVADKLE